MSETFSAAPAARPFKSGSISRPFLAVMVAGAVVLAGGYAVVSKSRASGDSGPQSGAFNPAPQTAQSATAMPAAPSVVVVKQDAPAKAAPAKIASAKPQAVTKIAARQVPAARPIAKTAPVVAKSAAQPKAAQPKAAPKKAASAPVASAPVASAPVAAAKPRLAAAPAAPRPVEAAVAGDWPEYRGKARDGVSRETGWFNGNEAQLVWKANIGIGFASMAIAQGRLYATGSDGNQDTVWCFNAADGRGVWKYSYPCDLMAVQHEGGPSATPTVEGGLVFTYSKRGQLHALDAATGKLIWRHDVPAEYGGRVPQWGVTSAPVVSGGTLFVMAGAPGACIMAFDKNTGAVQWKAGTDAPAYAALQIFRWKNVPYLAAFNAFGVVFYNLNDGSELWRYGWKTAYDVNAAMPLIADDKVFMSSGYNTGCALVQSSNNTLLWQNKNMRNHFSASVLVNGAIFGFDDSQLACLDPGSGKTLWTAGRLGKGSLIASDNKLIILSERGELVIADASPNGYRELSRSQILSGKCWTSPALANGRIYARNAAGDLVCVKF